MVIARNRALAVHHVTVHSIGGRLSVSLDLEVDGSLSLARAHEIADGLEAALREELGPGGRGRDPYRAAADGRDWPAAMRRPSGSRRSRRRSRKSPPDAAPVRDVHDVRVRETRDGEIVNFHCHVDPALTVAEVHDKVDDLERALRARFPAIKRVIGHAEPQAIRRPIS